MKDDTIPQAGLYLDILFDGPPGAEDSGRFVEVEDPGTGCAVKVGEWVERDGGKYWALRLPIPSRPVRDQEIIDAIEGINGKDYGGDIMKATALHIVKETLGVPPGLPEPPPNRIVSTMGN